MPTKETRAVRRQKIVQRRSVARQLKTKRRIVRENAKYLRRIESQELAIASTLKAIEVMRDKLQNVESDIITIEDINGRRDFDLAEGLVQAPGEAEGDGVSPDLPEASGSSGEGEPTYAPV